MHLDQISVLPQQRNEDDESNSNGIENELNAPIANIDVEDWLIDLISSDNSSNNAATSEMTTSSASSAVAFADDDDGLKVHNSNRKRTTSADRLHRYTEEYAADSIDLCNSLEDLVKTFDKNVKECLKNYKNIDIGQLAPVQVRTEDDLINDSQMWYTLTGNFGNLLPINYWSKNLIRRYHTRSLDLKLDCENSTRHKKPKQQRVQKITTTTTRRTGTTNKSQTSQQTNRNSYLLCNKQQQVEDEDDNYFYDEEEENFKAVAEKSQSRVAIESDESNSDDDEFLSSDNETTSDSDSDDTFDEEDEEEAKKKGQFEGDENNECGVGDEPLELDEIDDDELKEQLDMHSMIISRSLYNGDELDEPIITAEQVLNEIDSIIKLENDEVDYEERTPDSGCYSVVGGINTSSSTTDFNIDISYSKYINTFATQQEGQHQQHINDEQTYVQLSSPINEPSSLQTLVDLTPVTVVTTSKEELTRLNVFELNEIIDQIESTTKELSDILVHELALRDELEFEKETRNTFISLLMSIQEKRRKLSIDNCKNRHLASLSLSQKKKNRRSLGNFDFESNQPTHLTTVIPYNSGISSSVQNLQILINLLKAINEDSHQVPELLTNYILKVVCPT